MVVGGVALSGMIFLLIVWVMKGDGPTYYAQSLRNYQEADAVAGYPILVDPEADEPQFWTADFEPKMHLFREVERYQMPLATSFSNPLGDFVKVEDDGRFNSPAGGILGVGDPVFTAGNGRVMFSNVEKKLLIIGHRLEDGRIVTTRYGNVENPTVRVGKVVARGERVAVISASKERVGLEFSVTEAVGIDLPAEGSLNQLEPLAFLKEYAPESHWPEALNIKKANQAEGIESLQLDSESAQKLGEILSGE
ncbi:M23 family metallopeptidase [bacterium]|nr:M23 family metallopeptidase [bacterium]